MISTNSVLHNILLVLLTCPPLTPTPTASGIAPTASGIAPTSTEYKRNCDFYLIDYDKVTEFKFEIGFVAIRKIDEFNNDNKILSSSLKFARFLFQAMTSMSLVPLNSDLKNDFIRGYKFYLKTSSLSSLLETEIYNHVCNLIYEYE